MEEILEDNEATTTKVQQFSHNWQCPDYTILKCFQILANNLAHNGWIDQENKEITGKTS